VDSVAKTFSVAELGHGATSRALRAAQDEPVLVSRQNRPAAWIVSAEKLAQVAVAAGAEQADAYQRVLQLLAVELYRDNIITLGQGAKLASLVLSDFIDLCGRLHVPILWEPPNGIDADADALATIVTGTPLGS
jgi:predicted HTH domain antitoxin